MRVAKKDLEHILDHVPKPEALRKSRILLTGGTGFFGKWLIESFLFMNQAYGLNAKLVVLARDPELFLKSFPYFRQPEIEWVRGDILDFNGNIGNIDFCLHAATPASARLNESQPLEMLDVTIRGTRNILNLAAQAHCRRFLFMSSGAVYGTQPPELTHVPETYLGAPDVQGSASAYGEGKRVSELMGNLSTSPDPNFEFLVARCFAFVGPHLPLDTHFAIGNFILNALNGQPIVVKGDGTAFRSYLYSADLMIWLWTLFISGKNRDVFNVGDYRAVSIGQLAQLIGTTFSIPVEIKGTVDPTRLPARYVPDTSKATAILNLKTLIGLEDAIERTFLWYKQCRGQP